ncbi:hypothetical protein D3C77_34480 [compost metagenome]
MFASFATTLIHARLLSAVYMNEAGEGNDLGGTGTPVAPAPKTKRELLVDKANDYAAKYNATLALIKQIDDKAAAEAKLGNIAAGDRVDAEVGKGAKAQQILNALVIGVANSEEKGKQVKVQVGQGFDTQVYVLNATQILNVVTAAELAAAASAPQAEEAAE